MPMQFKETGVLTKIVSFLLTDSGLTGTCVYLFTVACTWFREMKRAGFALLPPTQSMHSSLIIVRAQTRGSSVSSDPRLRLDCQCLVCVRGNRERGSKRGQGKKSRSRDLNSQTEGEKWLGSPNGTMTGEGGGDNQQLFWASFAELAFCKRRQTMARDLMSVQAEKERAQIHTQQQTAVLFSRQPLRREPISHCPTRLHVTVGDANKSETILKHMLGGKKKNMEGFIAGDPPVGLLACPEPGQAAPEAACRRSSPCHCWTGRARTGRPAAWRWAPAGWLWPPGPATQLARAPRSAWAPGSALRVAPWCGQRPNI